MGRRLSATSFAGELFGAILDDIENVHIAFNNPRALLRYGGDVDAYRVVMAQIDEAKQRRALKDLERREYIRTRKIGKRLSISLTEKGLKEALTRAMQHPAAKLPKGTFCFVSFDIPKRERNLRETLRRILVEAEFNLIHHSLWASRFDYAVILARLVVRNNAEEWITVYVGHPVSPMLTDVEKKALRKTR